MRPNYQDQAEIAPKKRAGPSKDPGEGLVGAPGSTSCLGALMTKTSKRASSRLVVPESLRVVYSNACSIVNKLPELEQLLTGVDFLAVTESWLSSTHSDGLLPNGWVVHRCDRPGGHGGGCLFLVRDGLKQRPTPDLFHSPNIQMLGCVLEYAAPILLLCIYRSPGAAVEESLLMLDAIRNVTSDFDHLVIMWDFNALISIRRTCSLP